MKKLIKFILWVLLIWVWCVAITGYLHAQTTVTGTVFDAGGGAATSGFVEFDIQPQSGSVQYFVSGAGVIAPQSVVCGIDGTGHVLNNALTGPCLVWANSQISPGNTTYTVTFAPSGVVASTVAQECINGATYDLATPVFCPRLSLNPQSVVVITTPVQQNLIPGADAVFNVGSATNRYASGFFANVTTSSILGNPTFPSGLTPLGNVRLCSACVLTFGDSPDSGISRKALSPQVFMFGANGFNSNTGIIDASGYRIAGAALAGRVLRGDGTNFVSAQLAAADLSNGVTGSGAVVLATSPTLVTPVLGVASATSIQMGAGGFVSFGIGGPGISTSGGGVLAFGTSQGASNTNVQGRSFGITGSTSGVVTLSVPAVAGSNTWTVPAATDTAVGKATTDIFTNKTYDTAGAGNVFKINGTAVSAVTGSGSAVLASAPAIDHPTITTGITAASGFKHQRFGSTCTTGTTQGASCTLTLTWTVAFADANYSVVCQGFTPSNTPGGWDVETRTASNFVLRVFNLGTGVGASYGEVDCIGIHD